MFVIAHTKNNAMYCMYVCNLYCVNVHVLVANCLKKWDAIASTYKQYGTNTADNDEQILFSKQMFNNTNNYTIVQCLNCEKVEVQKDKRKERSLRDRARSKVGRGVNAGDVPLQRKVSGGTV